MGLQNPARTSAHVAATSPHVVASCHTASSCPCEAAESSPERVPCARHCTLRCLPHLSFMNLAALRLQPCAHFWQAHPKLPKTPTDNLHSRRNGVNALEPDTETFNNKGSYMSSYQTYKNTVPPQCNMYMKASLGFAWSCSSGDFSSCPSSCLGSCAISSSSSCCFMNFRHVSQASSGPGFGV